MIDYTTNNYGVRRREIERRKAKARTKLAKDIVVLFMSLAMFCLLSYATICTTKEKIIREMQITTTETGYEVELWGNIYTYKN